MNILDHLSLKVGRQTVGGCPQGYDAVVVSRLAAAAEGRDVLFVAMDEGRALAMAEVLAFFAPRTRVLAFPAWDCMPYDRISPRAEVMSRRLATLVALAGVDKGGGRVIVTTVNAILQRTLPREVLAEHTLSLKVGMHIASETLTAYLVENGFQRTDTVRDRGDFAQRGGIVDLFPPEGEQPLRVDFFGDEIEAIRLFDPATQRTTGTTTEAHLSPSSEVILGQEAVARFRAGYRALAGAAAAQDRLYEAVSAGRRYPGIEHFLPLFYDRLETLFDHLPEAVVVLDHQVEEAARARFELIADYYETRRSFSARRDVEADSRYAPLPPDQLYLSHAEWRRCLAARAVICFSPFAAAAGDGPAADAGGRAGEDFADARTQPGANVFDAVRECLEAHQRAGRRTLIAAYSEGSADRLVALLGEHGLGPLSRVTSWPEQEALSRSTVGIAVLGIERGFQWSDAVVVTEQDILGDRLVRRVRRQRRAEEFIAEASALNEGDLVVHVDHGIGRYEGLETIEVAGAPHDCLRIVYDGNDKLYVPVENIEVLSRYGADEGGARLDRLGTAAWQARAARVRRRLRDMAEELIRVAAERAFKPAPVLERPDGAYAEFCARFPYHETDDQLRAIEDCLSDLASGRPMDRLVCGDVGFGKTEVALRAAFITVMSGKQVAIVTPTTLLARQHVETFTARFEGLPVRIGHLSRLVGGREAAEVRRNMAEGKIDIVIGTHALLAKNIKFHDLGLIIVDEEQHFGVAQKERLKQLRSDVHVLTLTATPIPRTLQLALTGVREMSIIATPPVDRLAVRTFILPFDAVVVREALLREHFRGGQTFYVCPRIQDIPRVHERLKALVPEVRIVTAHGDMPAKQLDAVMSAFYEGRYDVLLCTQIIESGLDIPTANTMVIHRADMFGLAQLYQLRGRIGRSKVRAYAYLTLPPGQTLTRAAQRRLEVFQTLDTLGAGFTLASHDLDIRGAGNLLGEEQSGHIREVGIELYQQMLEEAVRALRAGTAPETVEHAWTPQITIGTPVLIPETYVPDLNVRLGLYRRLAVLVDQREIEAFAAELIDRFGPLPGEVENLLEIVAIKKLCRDAGVEKVEGGPRGAVIAFRNNSFANPAGLVGFIQKAKGAIRLRPDHRLVQQAEWPHAEERVKGVKRLLGELAALVASAEDEKESRAAAP